LWTLNWCVLFAVLHWGLFTPLKVFIF
jgi:hypothetical protein